MIPAAVLNLKQWYLTLPIGKKGSPKLVKQPELDTFEDESYFFVAGDSVVFKAPCDGVTTDNSNYPRSELREMVGDKLAAWSVAEGVHTLTFKGAVQTLPSHKPEVVIGQIHDDKDDVIEILCSKNIIKVVHDGTVYGVLDPKYILGAVYTITITASKGLITVDYNGLPMVKLKNKSSKANNYFKVGCYTQSNPSKGDGHGEYGEVWVSSVTVTHEK